LLGGGWAALALAGAIATTWYWRRTRPWVTAAPAPDRARTSSTASATGDTTRSRPRRSFVPTDTGRLDYIPYSFD
jgi:hypothetical protein